MPADTIVTMPDIPVMYVAGETGRPISEQAPKAFAALEAKLASLKGRRFYGVVVDDAYRACVALAAGEDVGSLPHPRWAIPGGRYARRRIADWEDNLHLIAPGFAALRARPDADPARPCIEFYRSRRELLLLAPVR